MGSLGVPEAALTACLFVSASLGQACAILLLDLMCAMQTSQTSRDCSSDLLRGKLCTGLAERSCRWV